MTSWNVWRRQADNEYAIEVRGVDAAEARRLRRDLTEEAVSQGAKDVHHYRLYVALPAGRRPSIRKRYPSRRPAGRPAMEWEARRINVRIPAPLYEAMERYAQSRGWTRAAVIRALLSEALGTLGAFSEQIPVRDLLGRRTEVSRRDLEALAMTRPALRADIDRYDAGLSQLVMVGNISEVTGQEASDPPKPDLSEVEATRDSLEADETNDEAVLTQPKVNGRPFRCSCGGNLFTKVGTRYTCNVCEEEFEGMAVL